MEKERECLGEMYFSIGLFGDSGSGYLAVGFVEQW